MVTIIYKLIISVPAILSFYEKVEGLILQHRINQIKDNISKISSARDAVMLAIEKAETNEERLYLSTLGHALSRGKVPAQDSMGEAR